MLISFRNILMNIIRIMWKQISMHPMTQSSWHKIKLPGPLIWCLSLFLKGSQLFQIYFLIHSLLLLLLFQLHVCYILEIVTQILDVLFCFFILFFLLFTFNFGKFLLTYSSLLIFSLLSLLRRPLKAFFISITIFMTSVISFWF